MKFYQTPNDQIELSNDTTLQIAGNTKTRELSNRTEGK
jgi:hypothetical protein